LGTLEDVEDTGTQSRLQEAIETLRVTLVDAPLPLELPGTVPARQSRHALVGQLDDYVLPRLREIDAPLLAVVGGSTGAGKSTLVNSVVGTEVSPAGVLRPTTRSPVLVHHPEDERWFTSTRILPGLARVTGASPDPGTLHLVASSSLPPGLALLDAPDIDSVVTANRELAAQLLAAADLWVFVTTAARYADAVPWDLLRSARERSAAVSVVLDRVPPEAMDEVTAHLARMLADRGLGEAPLFVIPETTMADGVLPPDVVAGVKGWLSGLAADATARYAVIRRTLDGALASIAPRVRLVISEVDAQARAARDLRSAVISAYAAAVDEVDAGLSDGSVLRGEVLARWQEYVGTGELLRGLEARVGRIRDFITARLQGRPDPTDEVKVALGTGVEALIRAAADSAAESTTLTWRATTGGASLLATADEPEELGRSSSALAERARRTIRDWQGFVLDLVRTEGGARRSTARYLSFGVNGAALAVMIAVFASTGGLTGAEVVVAGGATALSQKLLEAVFGDQAVRSLAQRARADLRERVSVLLRQDADRYHELLAKTGLVVDDGRDRPDPLAASRPLSVALADVEQERSR
jgi:Dynamin family